MISVKDFRIGNLVYKKMQHPIESHKSWNDIDYIGIEDLLVINNNENYSPISLTEEWLVKLGLEYNGESRGLQHYTHNIYELFDIRESSVSGYPYQAVACDDDYMVFVLSGIKYVHQLQNLFYALTGAELTVKQDK